MATPYRSSDSNDGPSGRMLRQLLEEINRVQSSRAAPRATSMQSPEHVQPNSPSVWVGGSSLAQDICEKLRAADTARWRRTSVNIVDGIYDSASPALRSESSEPDFQDAAVDGRAEGADAGSDHSPDPVKDPYDHIKHAMQGSPISTTDDPASSDGGHEITSSDFQASSFSDPVPRPLSPPMFIDVSLDDFSSSTTEVEPSPNEALSSATTTDTSAQPQSPETARNRGAHFFDDSTSESVAQKRPTKTVMDLRKEGSFEASADDFRGFCNLGGDNWRILRRDGFAERAPETRMMAVTSTNDAVPELSSFRPTDPGPQSQSGPSKTRPKLQHASTTNPTRQLGSVLPDEPAWLRPLHLVDTGRMSIYKNVHDDGPIRHALCLWCYRRRGQFRKVHKHGYESCGSAEVLDSHYWEDDTWPEDTDESDESDSSDS